jgi:hypothetical protein
MALDTRCGYDWIDSTRAADTKGHDSALRCGPTVALCARHWGTVCLPLCRRASGPDLRACLSLHLRCSAPWPAPCKR